MSKKKDTFKLCIERKVLKSDPSVSDELITCHSFLTVLLYLKPYFSSIAKPHLNLNPFHTTSASLIHQNSHIKYCQIPTLMNSILLCSTWNKRSTDYTAHIIIKRVSSFIDSTLSPPTFAISRATSRVALTSCS